ncbi:MAG: mechanosensitive ion channel domain-containing protein [Acidobacteriota bacterium]
MKRSLLTLIFIVLAFSVSYGNEFTEKLNGFEAEFADLKAKAATLDQFSPQSFPGFDELEKTNQLVELLDFNKRKFKLLLAQYNLITDKIFPYCKEQPASSGKVILGRLAKFTGSGEDGLIRIQRGLNHVSLKISRIEKEIEMVQLNKKNKDISKDSEKSISSSDEKLPLAERIDLLSTELEEIDVDLSAQLKKAEELKAEEKRRSDKIVEKTAETKALKAEAANISNPVIRLIDRTIAKATELRVNGLEIPLLNTTRTMIYLANTKISTLQERVSNIKKDSALLKERKKKEMLERLVKGVLVVFIAIFIVMLLTRISRMVSRKTLKKIEKSDKIDAHRKQRYQTLSSVVLSFIKIVLWVSATVWVLGVLNIDYGPFLLAAGGISLAIGFGAQSLVKDIVTGFFLLMEEQFALGDIVEINGKSGTIEKISLRTIKFRSLDGTLHIIPNGEISIVSNSTYQWSRAVVNIGVSYDVDSSKVMDTLRSICTSMYKDPEWRKKMLDEPTPQGILSFGDSCVNYRILAKTKTGEQWAVGREFNIRIQKAFNENNIDIPYNYINVVNVK